MKWWIKTAVQSLLAQLPGGMAFHEWLQVNYGELARLEDSSRFGNAALLLRKTAEHVGTAADGIRAVELGTGWVPAVPLAFMLAGIRVHTYDVRRLVTPTLYRRTVTHLGRCLGPLAEAAGVAEGDLQGRLDRLVGSADFHEAAKALGGLYAAPFDTRRLPYGDAQVDLGLSNLVLQYIPAPVLREVIGETYRILKPGGHAIHRIGMYDEYAFGDPGRGAVEFLRYSEHAWNTFGNNAIKYCNRLRASQFLEMFEQAGYAVASLRKTVDWDSVPRLRRRGVAPQFRHLSWEDLATTAMEVVLRKPMAVPHEAPEPPSCGSELALDGVG